MFLIEIIKPSEGRAKSGRQRMREQHQTGPEHLQGVPRSIFSVADLPQREKFEAWKDSISSIFDVEAEKEVAGSFHATLEATLIGPLLFARTETRRQAWSRTPRRIAFDGMDHYLIQYFEYGGHLDIEGASRGAGGYIVVFDLSRPLANTTSDFCNFSLLIPRPLLAAQLERPDEMHNLVVKGVVGSLLRNHILTLRALSDSLDVASSDRVSEATIGLVAACLNGVDVDSALRDSATSYAGIVQIKHFIDAHLHSESLTADRIARQNGVSRSKLYTMFERHGGVAAYIRARRLQHAFQALRDPSRRHRSLYDIALEAGYNNDAAFCRAFKNQFELTPGEVRRLRRVRPTAQEAVADASRRYEHWLHHLGATA